MLGAATASVGPAASAPSANRPVADSPPPPLPPRRRRSCVSACVIRGAAAARGKPRCAAAPHSARVHVRDRVSDPGYATTRRRADACAAAQPRVEAAAQRDWHRRQQPQLGQPGTGCRGVMQQPCGAAIGGGHLGHLRRREQRLQHVRSVRRGEAERLERVVRGDCGLGRGVNLPDTLARALSRASAGA
eukprot:scaffold28926_cov63-Phaeocystis_antarctica.AAC.3